MRRQSGLALVLAAVLTLPLPSIGEFVRFTAFPSALAATCMKEEAGAFFRPTVNSIGGRMQWKARSLTAQDWPDQGFAAEVLWVGTDNQVPSARWVEAGVTKGWQGTNILTFYTAHGDNTVSPHVYAEHRWTTAVSTGASYTFSGQLVVSNVYRVIVKPATGAADNWDWSNHHARTIETMAGSESTCGPPSQVQKVYVGDNAVLRQSDGAWVLATGGSLFDGSPNGGSAWCSTGLLFRYWMNDSNSTGCN